MSRKLLKGNKYRGEKWPWFYGLIFFFEVYYKVYFLDINMY